MRQITIAIVATEPSGDALGAGLMQQLKQSHPNILFMGIGGDKMHHEGFTSLVPQERLAVMGFIEPLKRLPEILSIRKKVITTCIDNHVDLYIGIDGPDFNLSIEKRLKSQGIKTMHFVSPTIWAWRPKRIFKIKKATHHNLLIFPFEKKIYDAHNVPATFVGHPLADEVPLESNMHLAREKLGLSPDKQYVALLPGSRQSELKHHATLVLETAKIMQEKLPDLEFLVPCVNQARLEQFRIAATFYPSVNLRIINGQTTEVLTAANASMVCSGTATLQALLCKRPFIIFYQTTPFTFWLAKKLVKTKFIGMANIIADNLLAPEFVQDDAVPKNMAETLLEFLTTTQKTTNFYQQCEKLHRQLQQGTHAKAANVVSGLIGG